MGGPILLCRPADTASVDRATVMRTRSVHDLISSNGHGDEATHEGDC